MRLQSMQAAKWIRIWQWAMQAAGIRFIATRTAGKDHIDKNAIKKCGIKAANVPGYSPNAISEHTVLLILSLLRKMKTQLKRIEEQYFFLNGLRGRELKSMTVGVIGTGKIGTATIQDLRGFWLQDSRKRASPESGGTAPCRTGGSGNTA